MADDLLDTISIVASDTTKHILRYGTDTAPDTIISNITPSLGYSYGLPHNYHNVQSLIDHNDHFLQQDIGTSEHIFGAQSVLADNAVTWTNYSTEYGLLIDNICFQSFLIVCFTGICLLVYFYKAQIASIFNIFRGQFYVEKLLDEQNRLFDIFANLAVTILIISISVASVKYLDIFYGAFITGVLPDWSISLLVPALCIIYSFIVLFQCGLLYMAGAITDNQDFTNDLTRLKILILGTGAIIISPVILLFAMSNVNQSEILGWIVAAVAAITAFFLLIKSYLLFIDRKVSIFYWFLYLCAVEIFPISFFIILLFKNV